MTVIDWLLDSDPAIRWQVMRDLTHEPAEVIAAERARIATEGWGARLLALQAPDGAVGRPAVVARLDRHVPRARAAAAARPRSRQRAGPARHRARPRARHLAETRPSSRRWADNRFFEGEVEPCINGNVVATGAYFGVDMRAARRRDCSASSWRTAAGTARSRTARRCRRSRRRSTCSRACSSTSGRSAARTRCARPASAARRTSSSAGCSAGKSTGEVIDEALAPVLVPDLVPLRRPARPRLPARRRRDAGRARRGGDRGRRSAIATPTADGRSRTSTTGATHIEMEAGEGPPSRWNTLRALRVLEWYAQGG